MQAGRHHHAVGPDFDVAFVETLFRAAMLEGRDLAVAVNADARAWVNTRIRRLIQLYKRTPWRFQIAAAVAAGRCTVFETPPSLGRDSSRITRRPFSAAASAAAIPAGRPPMTQTSGCRIDFVEAALHPEFRGKGPSPAAADLLDGSRQRRAGLWKTR